MTSTARFGVHFEGRAISQLGQKTPSTNDDDNAVTLPSARDMIGLPATVPVHLPASLAAKQVMKPEYGVTSRAFAHDGNSIAFDCLGCDSQARLCTGS